MRLRRLAYPALAVTLALAGTSALAAKPKPKPVCFLLTDPEGDGRSQAIGAYSSPLLDILSGDVATGPKTVVVVLRMKTTDLMSDQRSMLGMSWRMTFQLKGATYLFSANHPQGSQSGVTGSWSVNGTSTNLTDGFRIANNAYNWTIPRSAAPAIAKAVKTNKIKAVFDHIAANSNVPWGNADGAVTEKTYTDFTPSCVAAA